MLLLKSNGGTGLPSVSRVLCLGLNCPSQAAPGDGRMRSMRSPAAQLAGRQTGSSTRAGAASMHPSGLGGPHGPSARNGAPAGPRPPCTPTPRVSTRIRTWAAVAVACARPPPARPACKVTGPAGTRHRGHCVRDARGLLYPLRRRDSCPPCPSAADQEGAATLRHPSAALRALLLP